MNCPRKKMSRWWMTHPARPRPARNPAAARSACCVERTTTAYPPNGWASIQPRMESQSDIARLHTHRYRWHNDLRIQNRDRPVTEGRHVWGISGCFRGDTPCIGDTCSPYRTHEMAEIGRSGGKLNAEWSHLVGTVKPKGGTHIGMSPNILVMPN